MTKSPLRQAIENHLRVALAVIVCSSMAFACSTGAVASPESTPLPARTYYANVAPILELHCVKCHHEGGIGPFALTSYESAHAMAPALVQEVVTKRMPPWGAHATGECSPPLAWRDDERLSDEDIVSLYEWNAAGAPAGDPSTAAIEAAPALSSTQADAMVELIPRAAFTPVASGADEFRCFVIEAPELEGGAYLSAIDVVPGNPKVVHHVSVYGDVGGVAAKRAGPDGSFDCPPGSLTTVTPDEPQNASAPLLSTLFAWAPGAKPLELPSTVGIRVAPSSKILMEVHYSTGGRTTGSDLTRIQATIARAKPEYLVTPLGVGNFERTEPNGDGLQPGNGDRNGSAEFRIPMNAQGHVELMVLSWPHDTFAVFGLRPHAHLAATDLKIDVEHEGVEQCLLQDRWDFHWQRLYTYDAALESLPRLHKGDKVKLRCTYDNSMMNRRLATELRERGLPPMDMFGGQSSLEEMCMVDVLVVQPNP